MRHPAFRLYPTRVEADTGRLQVSFDTEPHRALDTCFTELQAQLDTELQLKATKPITYRVEGAETTCPDTAEMLARWARKTAKTHGG